MKFKLLILSAVFTFALSSCQKDLAVDWAGTYTGANGSTFNQVVVSKVNKNTVKIELQQYYLPTASYITYATVGSGKLSSASAVSVDEDGSIITDPGVSFHFTGAGSLSGNTLTLSGQAQNKNNTSDIRTYVFSGIK